MIDNATEAPDVGASDNKKEVNIDNIPLVYKDLSIVVVEKPTMIEVKWDNIPNYLTTFADFFFWKYIWKNEKWVKHPLTEWSEIQNRLTLNDIRKIHDKLPNKHEVGLGFSFNSNNDLIGIDIDACFNPANPNTTLSRDIDNLIQSFNCYTELSPSKSGVHIIARVKDKSLCPPAKTDLKYPGCAHIEYYKEGRWFAMTGAHSQQQNDITYIDEDKLKSLVGDNIQKEYFKAPDIIEAGGRNNLLFRMSCSLRSKGLSEQAILAAIREENIIKCKPPLSDNDVIVIANQAAKYSPSSPIIVEDIIKQVNSVDLANLKFDQTDPLNYPFKDDLIYKFIDFHKDMSDAYIDFHHANALMILSTIIDRKAVLYTRQTTVFPNMWIFLVAQSTVVRKTTIINQLYDFNYILYKKGRSELPKQFTPESLIEQLSNNPHSYYINDECAGLIKSMAKKTYMADMRDILCGIYENRGFTRKLRTKKTGEQSEFTISDPYTAMLFATTPNNIARHVDYDDFASGWLVRFLYYYPRYDKPYMSLTSQTDIDISKKTQLTQDISKLESFFSELSSPIKFAFNEEAEIYFSEWGRQLELGMMNIDDDVIQTAAGRLMVYAIKLAMIYEIAKDDFIEKFKGLEKIVGGIDSWTGIDFKYPISLPTIKEACREVDEYYLPMVKRVSRLVEEGDLRNDQVKILNSLKRKGGRASRTEISRLTHLSAKQLKDAIEALVMDSEQIEVIEVKTQNSDKPTTYLVLKEELKC